MPAIPSQSSERQRRKAVVEQFLRAALQAVEPGEAVRRAIQCVDDALVVDGKRYQLAHYRRLLVVGGGKAAAAMAQAVEDVLGDRIAAGVVATKPGYTAPLRTIRLRPAGHPIPDPQSVAAAREIMALLAGAGASDLVIVLVSGGASALLALPASGLRLSDKRRVTDALLRSGATIDELNCVRKHLSAIKGGRLARAAHPATLVALILSDVVGNRLDVIASGPTAPDPTSYRDARDVLRKYDLLRKAPQAVVRHLEAGIAGALPETAKPGDQAFAKVQNVIVGSNRLAAEAALSAARDSGWNAMLLSTHVEGEAREVGRVFAGVGREIEESGRPVRAPGFVVAGGETTVTVRGSGRGGRNQELALSAAIQLAGSPRIVLASIATDGGDGPTEAAGAYGDGTTIDRARALGLDATAALANNDSSSFFGALGDLIVTGPTNTNVNDLIFLLAFDGKDGAREVIAGE